MRNQKFSFRAFTLIEILVVVAIIGLLASIVLVSIKEVRERAKVAVGLNFAAQVHHALGAYAVGIWDFDDGAEETATDSSGNDNHGNISDPANMWKCADIDGKEYTPSGKGCSLEFDGNDYVEIPDLGSKLINGFTYVAWVKTYVGNDGQQRGIVSQSSAPFMVKASSGSLGVRMDFELAGVEWYCYSGEIPVNKWTYVVITWNKESETLTTYINGEVECDQENTPSGDELAPRSGPFYIGKTHSTGQYFNGLIDEVRVYEQVLTSAQIRKLYVEGVKKKDLAVE